MSRVRGRVLPFTGILPVLVMVPLLAFELYAVAIVLGLAGGLAVVAFHLRRGQGATSLDLLLIGFAALNAILYFGFDNAFLVDHVDAVIYSLLTVQAAASLFGPAPWTMQFTRRVMSPATWDRREFLAINRSSTLLWAAGFAACDLLAVLAGQPWRLYGPIVVMVALAVLSRRVVRAHLAWLLGVPADRLPPEWLASSAASSSQRP